MAKLTSTKSHKKKNTVSIFPVVCCRTSADSYVESIRVVKTTISVYHDDVIKWKHFPRYWPFVRGIHRSPVNPSHKGQWRGALMFSLICTRINGWVNNGEADGLRRQRVHYDVTVMFTFNHYQYPCHIIISGYEIQIFRYANDSSVHILGQLRSLKLSYNKADSRFAPSQWETSLQNNTVSYWLGAKLELALL